MKTMGHKIQTRIISALLVFVMVFASIVSAGLVLDVDFGKMFSALGFGSGNDSGTNLALNTTNPGSFITAEGNYGYEITASPSKLTVDGVRDSQYTVSGMKLTSNYIMPASASKFDVYFAADDTNLYVLYEFSKAEQIFYNSAYTGGFHHFDLAEFNFNLDAAVKSGSTVQILGGVQGGKGTAVVNGSVPAAITDYYVKHTGLGGHGYNVEFCIPLSQITGSYNGAKAMTFSALSTIDTAYSGAQTAPTRTYTYAQNAWGDAHLSLKDADTPKLHPSTLIIRESFNSFTTQAGNIGNYLVKSDSTISFDGIRDAIYDTDGIKVSSEYNNTNGSFDLSIAADSEYVYFFYEVTKTCNNNLLYGSHSSWWCYDNIDFVINLAGSESTSFNEMRLFVNQQGYAKDPTTGADGNLNSNGSPLSYLDNYCIKYETTPGQGDTVEYVAELRVDINDITGNVNGHPAFNYLAMVTTCITDGSATYPRILSSYDGMENTTHDNNKAKEYRNMLVLVDSEEDIKPITKESDTTFVPEATVDYTTGYGAYGYFLNETDKATVIDGYRDVAYADGLKFSNKYNRPNKFGNFTYPVTPAANSTYTLYITADANKVSFLYEFVDDNIVIDAASPWYNDGVQFSFNEKGLANGAPGNNSIYYTTGPRIGTIMLGSTKAPYVLVKTDVGYNVEFTVDRSAISNGDTFSFLGRSTLADSATQRTYGFTENPTKSAYDDAISKYCSQVHICDTNAANNSSPVDAIVNDGGTNGDDVRWKYYIVESDGTFNNDGVLDAAYADGLVFHQAYNRVQGPATNKNLLPNDYFTVYVAADAENLHYFYEVTDTYITSNAPSGSPHWNDSLHFRMDKNASKNAGVGGNQVIQASATVQKATFGQQEQTFTYSTKHTDKGYNVEITVPRAGFANGGTTFSWVGCVSIASGNANAFGSNTYGFTANAGGDAYDPSMQNYANLFEIVKEKPVVKADISNLYGDITAPEAGANATDTDIFSAINNSAEVVIVYPKDATQALLDQVVLPSESVRQENDTYVNGKGETVKYTWGVYYKYYNSLAPLASLLTKASVREEGAADIANFDYKILVGHVNSYAETKTMIDTIGYDKYGVGVFGNTISIMGATEQMLEAAVETFKAEYDGFITPKTLYYGSSPAVAGASLPYVENAKIVTDNGYGAYQIVKNGVDYAAFKAYCNALVKNGYLLQSYNNMGGGYITKTYYNANEIVTVAYGLRYSFLLYSSGDNGKNFYDANDGNLDLTENAMSVSVSSRAVSDLPENRTTDYEKVTTTVYAHATQDWDLVEIVRLENGEFLVFDAAHTDDAMAILTELYKLSGGEKPVVAGWFLSHFHQDHIGGLVEIGMKYHEVITVKNVISQIGSEHLQGTCYNYRGNAPSTSDKANILNFLPAMENLGAKITTVATGQVYNFANASVEVLYTFADSMPFRLSADDTNRTGAIFSLTLHSGTSNTRFNINGDTTTEEFNMSTKRYGSYLKADVVQVAHHGNGEANNRCTTYYKTIDPTYVIISRNYNIGTNLGTSDQAIIDYVIAKDKGVSDVDDLVIYAAVDPDGDGTYTPAVRYLNIPYTAGKYATVGELNIPGEGSYFAPIFNNIATGIEDSENGAAANSDNRITMPVGTLENGSYLYVANTFYGDITTDGTKDNAYSYGIHLKNNKVDGAANNDAGFDVWLVAGQDGKIHVFYEVTDNYYFTTTETGWNSYRQDGADFSYGFTTLGTLDGNFRIKAVDGANTLDAQRPYRADSNRDNIFADRDDKNEFAVKVTAADGVSDPVIGEPAKYTIEFTIDNNGKAFTNGDMMTFLPVVNSISKWATGADGGYKLDETTGEYVGHNNVNLQVDNSFTSAYGSYHNPMLTPSQGKHNVLVFSSAPATQQAQRPASGSDNGENCTPTGDNEIMEIVTSVDKNVAVYNGKANGLIHGQAVYGIKTAYADFTIDGEMEDIYKYGHKVSDKYGDIANLYATGDHGFDAYIIYGQDGKVHVFVEVTDETMPKDAGGNKTGYGYGFETVDGHRASYWRRDSVHFYYNFVTDGTAAYRSSKSIWIGAVAGGDQSGVEHGDGPLPETGTYFVKMTDKGYNVEFVLDRNGSDFNVGDYFEFGLYLNCANSEVADTGTKDGEGNAVWNTTKYSVTHGSYYVDNHVNAYVSPNEYAYDGIKIVSTDSVTVKHNYNAVVTEPTCTENGYTTYTCTECGHSYVDDEVEATGIHSFNGDYQCDNCAVVAPRASKASIALKDRISVYFKVATSCFNEDFVFEKAVFQYTNQEGETITEVTELPQIEDGYYVFKVKMNVNNLGVNISCHIYTKYNGETIIGRVTNYSVKQYCMNNLNKLANATNPEDLALRKLLVDILNYGAAAQTYSGALTNALANADLTDAQKAWGSDVNVDVDAVKHTAKETESASDLAVIYKATIILNDGVKLRFGFTPDNVADLANMKVEMRTESGATYYTNNFFVMVNDNSNYYCVFDNLNPAQFREKIYITVYILNDLGSYEKTSGTLTYSVESYAAGKTGDVKTLTQALMKYGDSTKAYVDAVS